MIFMLAPLVVDEYVLALCLGSMLGIDDAYLVVCSIGKKKAVKPFDKGGSHT
jgi:hypothetical protein